MKHTEFYEQEKELKRIAIRELAKAVEAHGGRYEWCDENGNFPEDAQPPYVCVFLDSGPTDVKIASVIHDDKGWYVSGESTDEYCPCDVTIDDLQDIVSASQIQNITEAIPATEEVDDATVLQPQAIGWLDGDDLEVRDFDSEKVTNEQLQQIASKMLDYYLDGEFYSIMEDACRELDIPKVEEDDEEEN